MMDMHEGTQFTRIGARARSDGGFALAGAIFALVIIGVLVTGGFFMANQETRIGTASENSALAFYVAERGINEVLENWNAAAFRTLDPWQPTTLTGTTPEGAWEVDLTRMADFTYLLDATSTITQGGARYGGATRRMGMVVKLRTASIDPPAALTTRGNVSIRGGAEVTGFDIVPPGWDFCPPAGDPKTGVLTDPDGSVSTNGGGAVNGDPPTDTDPAIGDSTFTQFGDLSWAELTAMATRTFPGGNFNGMAPSFNADGSCNLADPNNWGDPDNPGSACGTYFPIIYVTGNALIQSAAVGQGILLVDGDVDLRGSFTYHGIIITQGNFETQGSGHRIMGGVMASNAALDNEKIVGASIVQNSTCAVTQALLMNPNLTRPVPIAERSWVDLSNLNAG